jgi:hypothetical protein
MQTVQEYLISAVAERRMMDRKIKEGAIEKRRVTHINAIININISDRKEGLEASERTSEGPGYVNRWKT